MDGIKFINLEPDDFISDNKDKYNGSLVIYKNMPLNNALKTLLHKELWFANPSEWHDLYEKNL